MPVSGVYLDYNATTPVDPRVLEAMLPFFSGRYGNPASALHAWGWEAQAAVTVAREQVAHAIGAQPSEIVFTSGATEGMNLLLQGTFEAMSAKGRHIISSPTEHKAVLDTLSYLERRGAEITLLPVDSDGYPDLELLEASIRPDTIAVSLMWANNETGLLLPIHSIAEICHSKGTLFITDATQAVGKVPVNITSSPIAGLAASAHKLYGPKGIGFVFIRRKEPRFRPLPIFHGGGHEHGFRSGTLNVPGIIGMAGALQLAVEQMDWDRKVASRRRNTLENLITQRELGHIRSANRERLNHVTSVTLDRFTGKELALKWPWMGFSMGSACTSAKQQPSHVLAAMGLLKEEADRTIRISTGRMLTDEAWERVILAFQELG